MKKLNILSENKFFKNIMMLASGTAFAQILTIAMSPIITRLYLPEEYGMLTVYISLLTLLSIGASLDYQKAIPISKDNKEAYNLIAGAFFILTTFTIALSIMLLFVGKQLIIVLDSEALIDYIFLIPLGVFFVSGYNIVLHWSLRTKDFKIVTRTKITQSIVSNFSKTLLGLIGFGPIGLIVGHIIGQSGGILRLSTPLITIKEEFITALKWVEVKKLLIRYIKFPLYSAPSNYIYTAGSQAPVIMLTAIFGPALSGFYGLANSIVSLPITLIAISVSQVFYSEVASIGKNNPQKIKILSLKLSGKLALIGMVPLLILALFGPWLFSTVFGENWYNAGIYARVLAFVAYAHFIILPSGRILEVLEKQNIGLIINAFRLILIVLTFICASSLNFTALQTIMLYALVSIVSYLILFIVVQKTLSNEVIRAHTKLF